MFWNIFTTDGILSAEKDNDKYKYYEWLDNKSTNAWKVICDNFKNLPFDQFLQALDDFKFENCIMNKK